MLRERMLRLGALSKGLSAEPSNLASIARKSAVVWKGGDVENASGCEIE